MHFLLKLQKDCKLNSSTTKVGVKNGDNVNLLDVTTDDAKKHINQMHDMKKCLLI